MSLQMTRFLIKKQFKVMLSWLCQNLYNLCYTRCCVLTGKPNKIMLPTYSSSFQFTEWRRNISSVHNKQFTESCALVQCLPEPWMRCTYHRRYNRDNSDRSRIETTCRVQNGTQNECEHLRVRQQQQDIDYRCQDQCAAIADRHQHVSGMSYIILAKIYVGTA